MSEPARRLRIAMLSRRFDPAGGGAERYAIALTRELAARHELHVFAQEFCIALPGVTAHPVPQFLVRPRWLNLCWFSLWTHWHTRRGYDIVHAHEGVAHGNVHTIHVRPVKSALIGASQSWQRARRWLSACSSPRLAYYLWVEKRRLRAAPRRAVIAVSRTLSAELVATYPALSGHVDVLPPGVELPAVIDDRARTRLRFGISPMATMLLFIAGDYDKKGLPALLTAMAQLPPEVELLVVGNAGYIEAAQHRAQALGVLPRVRFAGVLADPGPAYRAADLLVHPTLEDTWAMVVQEAMAHGLPVVVSGPAWCGIAAELADGRNALLLADPRDAAALAAQIRRVLEQPGLRGQLSLGARAFAAEHSWPALALDHEHLYQRLLAAR